MNLSQIERRFQAVDFMANYVNYKYNPHIGKVSDLKQHIYKDLLKTDALSDQKIYGLAAFQEGDPAEIIRGSQKMSTIGGGGASRRNLKGSQRSQRETQSNTRSGSSIMQQTVNSKHPKSLLSDASMRGLEAKNRRSGIAGPHAKSHAMLNSDLMPAANRNALQGRPYTSKPGMSRSGVSIGVYALGRTRSTASYSKWSLGGPLRQRQGAGQNASHLINRSKLDISELPSADKVSTQAALGRYHAQKVHKLMHRPRDSQQPTVFYKVGDNLKTKTETMLEASPSRPKNFKGCLTGTLDLNDRVSQPIDAGKEEQYGNLMKQLYKIKIPDQILAIIRQANTQKSHPASNDIVQSASGQDLMDIINTQYISPLVGNTNASKSQPKARFGSKGNLRKGSAKPQAKLPKLSDKSTLQALPHSNSVAKHTTVYGSRNALQKATSGGNEAPDGYVNYGTNANVSTEGQNLSKQWQEQQIQLRNDGNSSVSTEAKRRIATAMRGTSSVPDLDRKQSVDEESGGASIKDQTDHPIFMINDRNMKHVNTLKGPTSQNTAHSNSQQKQNQTNQTSNLTHINSGQLTPNNDLSKRITERGGPNTVKNQLASSQFTKLVIAEERNNKSPSMNRAALVQKQGSALSGSIGLGKDDVTLSNEHSTIPLPRQTPLNEPVGESPRFLTQIKSQSRTEKPKQKSLDDGRLLFNLKITDLTQTENPFVFFENQQVDSEGYLLFQDSESADQQQSLDKSYLKATERKPLPKASIFKSYNNLQQFGSNNSSLGGPFDNQMDGARSRFERQDLLAQRESQMGKTSLGATIMLPWLEKPSDLEKRTLKIEVTFKGELILLRIIHIDKLYPVEYPKIALQVANSMIQSNLLREKKVKVQEDKEGARQGAPTRFIQVENKIMNKWLTKASSAATYDTALTQNFLRGSAGLGDLTTVQAEESDHKPQEDMLSKEIKVHQNASPEERHETQGDSKNPNERSQIILTTRNQNPGLSMPDAAPSKLVNEQSKNSILVKTDDLVSENISMTKSHDPMALQQSMPPVIMPTQFAVKSVQDRRLSIHKVSVSGGEAKGTDAYFWIQPEKNDILDILQELERFELNVMDLAARVEYARLLRFPEVMKNLQLIIEFSDCIVQGKDLLNFDIIIDEDEGRLQRTRAEAAALRQGLPNEGKIQGVQVSPQKVAHQTNGIIKERVKDTGKAMSPERTSCIKSYIKSNAANYLVLRSTSNTLGLIREAQKNQLPLCASRMKSKKDQFNFLHNSNALHTAALPPQERMNTAMLCTTLQTAQFSSRHKPVKVSKLVAQAHREAELRGIDTPQHDVTLNRLNSGDLNSVSPKAHLMANRTQDNRPQHASFGSNLLRDSDPNTKTPISRGSTLIEDSTGGAAKRNHPIKPRYSVSGVAKGKQSDTRNTQVQSNQQQQPTTLRINNQEGTASPSHEKASEDDGKVVCNDEKEDEGNKVTSLQGLKLMKEESEVNTVPPAVYSKDQIIVTQGVRQTESLQFNQNTAALLGGLNNQDLAMLRDPAIHPVSLEPAEMVKIENELPLDRAIATHEHNQVVKVKFQRTEPSGHKVNVLHSDEFQRQSLLKKNKMLLGLAEAGTDSENFTADNYTEKPVGSPIGPIAYVSKYQHSNYQQQQHATIQGSSVHTNLLHASEQVTNYGLASNQAVPPLVQQRDAREIQMRSSLSSKQYEEIQQQAGSPSQPKRPNHSVLQHQTYVDTINPSLSSPSAAAIGVEKQHKEIQMLAPVSNYLYRGSNARKTVRQLLDAKHESDAAMLYEAITNRKFDVPIVHQDLSQNAPGPHQALTHSLAFQLNRFQ